MRIELDDLSRPEVHALPREHLENMHELSPPESVHARGAIGASALETGSHEAFEPAQKLYESFGFTPCGPLADSKADPNSVFMSLEL